jgi:hypothetical protein
MSSLQRAQQFLARKASRLALAIVPLAALTISAPPAKAGAILAPGTCVVSGASGVSGSCSSSQISSIGGNNQLNWIALAGSGSVSSEFGGTATFTASGSANSGSISAGSVPVSWNFTLTDAENGSFVDWTVMYTLDVLPSGGSLQEYTYTNNNFSDTGTTPTPVTGSASLAIPTGGDVEGWEIELETFSNGTTYSVNVPAGSTLDLNPQASGAPEPATLFLIPAAGALLFLRRKKRSQ